MFRSRKPDIIDADTIRRVARCEATCEGLEMKWVNYRDELKKLVSRLEKREQRLEQKLREAAAGSDGDAALHEAAPAIVDRTTARVLARRKPHVPG